MSLSKQHLKNPERIAQIKRHREKRKELDKPGETPKIRVIDPEPFIMHDYDSTRRKLQYLREIYLKDMRGKGTYHYIGRFIELAIIEESYFEYSTDDFATAYKFLVEDENGDVFTLQVLGLPQNENTAEMFAVGMKVILVNPSCHYVLYSSIACWLHVGEKETKSIIPVGKMIGMCRYCGEENAKKKCVNCECGYCGRECQLADWKILKHKLVCGLKVANGTGEPKETSNGRKIKFPPSYLENPRRLHSLWIRMKNLASLIPSLPGVDYDFMFANDPAEKPFIPPKVTKPMDSDLKQIYLKDMKYEDFYECRFIELTIIEEPFMADPKAVSFVVEDSNMDVCNLVIYGIPVSRRDKTLERFVFAAKLKVANPVYKIRDADMLPMIMADGLKMIEYLGKKVDRCRYCGKENATMKCSNCDHSYCGRKCQLADWNVLKHELVCCKTGEKKGDSKMGSLSTRGRKEKDLVEAKASEKVGAMKISDETPSEPQAQAK